MNPVLGCAPRQAMPMACLQGPLTPTASLPRTSDGTHLHRDACFGTAMPHFGPRRASPTNTSTSRSDRSTLLAPRAYPDAAAAALTIEQSELVNKEIVLFIFQLEMDAQLQRALTYEKFDVAKEVRSRRSQVDTALSQLQEAKGYGCGARRASKTAQFEYAPAALSLRSRLAAAVAEERYQEAADLRDQLALLEERAAEAELPCPVAEPRFTLGQMVVHSTKGYRGVVAGWDLACCELPEWQAAAGIDKLPAGHEQVFYHVLVDVSDWPMDMNDVEDDDGIPPVAYVAEELLSAVSIADFAAAEPLVDSSFSHPYSYLMFLGSDGRGNMIPCRQLREKYCAEREDRYADDDDEDDEEGEFSGSDDDGGDGGFGGGPEGRGGDDDGGSGEGIWSGGPSIPGIDMSSLQ